MLLRANLLDRSLEAVEGTVNHFDTLALNESNFTGSTCLGFAHQTDEFVHLSLRNGFRFDSRLTAAQEAQDIRDIAQERKTLVAQIALYEHVSRKQRKQ